MRLTVAIILIIIPQTKAIVNPHGPTVVKDFSDCITEMMEYNFKQPGLFVFANTDNVSSTIARIGTELLRNIHNKLIYSVEMKYPRDEPPICERHNEEEVADLGVGHMDQFKAVRVSDYYIVILDNYDDFSKVASRIIRSRTWNPQAKFIILLFHLATSEKYIETLVEMIVSCLFKFNVVNIAVIVPQVNNIRKANIYSWYPFQAPQFCGYFNESANNRLVIENSCENGILKGKESLYSNRIPHNMTGCILNILALERQPFMSANPLGPNIEKYFINQLASMYGFETRYELLTGFRGERNDSGNWDGALRELVAKKGHLLLGGIFPDFDVHEDFACSEPYLADSYTWVAPRAFASPPWVALIIIFQTLVWYCVVATFVLCAFTWKFLGVLSKESQYHNTFRHCFMNTWISMLGFCGYARPVRLSLRVFYVFFNLYCILFITGYTTKLIDVLQNPSFEEQIDTIEEIVESGLKFGGSEELHDLFQNSSDPFDYMLGEKWVDVDNISKALIDVTVHRNFTVLCSRLELAHLSATMPELSDSFGNYRYYAFQNNMFSAPMEMVALRGFSYMKRFSKTLQMFNQMGLNAALRRYFDRLNTLRRSHLLRFLGYEEEVKALSTQHLQGGFLVLVMGYVSGSVVLLLEIAVNSEYVKYKVANFKSRWSWLYSRENQLPFTL